MAIRDNLVVGAIVVGSVAATAVVGHLIGKAVGSVATKLYTSRLRANTTRNFEACVKRRIDLVVKREQFINRGMFDVELFAIKCEAKIYMSEADYDTFEAFCFAQVEATVAANHHKFKV